MSSNLILDTNVISEINKKLPNRLVVDKLSKYKQELATATPVIHELLFGALRLFANRIEEKSLLIKLYR